MNIIKIYEKYLIPEHLQMHMLRVAACGLLISEKYKGNDLNKEQVARILLMHDMGNIIKITQEQTDNEKFLRYREEWINEFGKDDHVINNIIAKREGITDEEIKIMDEKILKNNEKTANCNSYITMLAAYCDQRVAPNGVVPIKERLEELKQRHQSKKKGSMSDENTANRIIESAIIIEKKIMEQSSIKPEDINDKTIEPYIKKLRDYDIQNLRKEIEQEIE